MKNCNEKIFNYNFSNVGGFESIKIFEKTANVKNAGFLLYDAAERKEAFLEGEVKEISGGIKHTTSALGVDFSAEYSDFNNGVKICGRLVDKTGKDRLLSLYFKIPLNEDYNYWWDDIGTKCLINETKKYSNSCPMSYSQMEQKTSLYLMLGCVWAERHLHFLKVQVLMLY